MKYPTLREVETASDTDLQRWNRFLPSPADDDQQRVLEKIVDRYNERKAADPDAMVAASKAVGW